MEGFGSKLELPVEGHSAVCWRDRVVVYGGKKGDGVKCSDVWLLNPNDGVCDYLPPQGTVPRGHAGHSAHIFENVMYVVNGLTEGEDPEAAPGPRALPVFDLTTLTWGTAPTKGDGPRCSGKNHASALVDNIIYVFGGWTHENHPYGSDMATLFALNLDNLTWRRMPTQKEPAILWGHSMVACGKNLMVFGGVDTSDQIESDVTWVYSLKAETWTSYTSAPPAGAGDAADTQSVAGGGRVVRALYRFTATADKLHVALEPGDTLEVLPCTLTGWMKGRHLKDGTTGYFPTNYVEEVDRSPSRVSSQATVSVKDHKAVAAPSRRCFHASVALDGGKAFLIWGGEVGHEKVTRLHDTWRYDVRKGKWKQVGKRGQQPPALACHPMVYFNQTAFVPMMHERQLWALDVHAGWVNQALSPIYSRRGGSPGRPTDPATPASPIHTERVVAGQPPSPSHSSSTIHNITQQYFPQDHISTQQSQAQATHASTHGPSTPATAALQSHHSLPQAPQSAPNTPGAQFHQSQQSMPGSHGPISILPTPGGNVINIDKGTGQQPVVVYVMPGQGGHPSLGPSMMPYQQLSQQQQPPQALPMGAAPLAPEVAPYASGPGRLASVPSEPLREPARARVGSRQRTASPHIHTPSGDRARAVPYEGPSPSAAAATAHSPQRQASRSGATVEPPSDAATAHNQQGTPPQSPSAVGSPPQHSPPPNHPRNTPQPPTPEKNSPPAAAAAAGGKAGVAFPVSAPAHVPAEPAPQASPSTPRATAPGAPPQGRQAVAATAPASAVPFSAPVAAPHEPERSASPQDDERLPSRAAHHQPGPPGTLTASKSVLMPCPDHAATPPRPLIPLAGRPHSPPRSTGATHGLIDPAAV